jgi:hypothetical protein
MLLLVTGASGVGKSTSCRAHPEAIALCLLDASADAQAARLRARGDPDLLRHHEAFADWMRETVTDPLYRAEVITTGGWDPMRWDA